MAQGGSYMAQGHHIVWGRGYVTQVGAAIVSRGLYMVGPELYGPGGAAIWPKGCI